MSDLLIALLVGLVQGLLEWLPVSSEGAVALVAALVGGFSPAAAVQFGLFLHLGTALSATAYYRAEIAALLADLRRWRPKSAFGTETADLSFLVLATLATGLTGVPALLVLDSVLSEFEGAAFVALIGALLVATGVLQRFANERSLATRETPNALDALLVGGLQGLAILPGVSRSGTTTSALLLRGHDGPASFRLSFLLSIPAALIGGTVGVVRAGGVGVAPTAGLVALVVAAVVGYATIDLLMRIVRRVAVWLLCVGLGVLAIVGGLLV